MWKRRYMLGFPWLVHWGGLGKVVVCQWKDVLEKLPQSDPQVRGNHIVYIFKTKCKYPKLRALFFHLDQSCPIEHYVMVEMFYIFPVQYGSCLATCGRGAPEMWLVGWRDEFQVSFHFQLVYIWIATCGLWPVDTTDLDRRLTDKTLSPWSMCLFW